MTDNANTTMATPIFALPDNADELIRAKVADEWEWLKNFGASEILRSTRLHDYSDVQRFAVFQHDARELRYESNIQPALIDDTAFLMLPDEGQTGVLHWLHDEERNKTWLSFIRVGWVRHEELEQTPEQVSRTIAEEVDAGENHYTGLNRPG